MTKKNVYGPQVLCEHNEQKLLFKLKTEWNSNQSKNVTFKFSKLCFFANYFLLELKINVYLSMNNSLKGIISLYEYETIFVFLIINTI